jgi:DNA-binding MarR family transcriptional regulator
MDGDLRSAARTLAMAGRGLERAAAPLSLPQYRILALVASAPDRASRLAARAQVTKGTLSGVLDALEGHGWIQRVEVDGDRRGVSLLVTPLGAEVLDRADGAMSGWLGEVLDAAGGEAAATVTAAMRLLADGLAAVRRQGVPS